MPYRHKEIKKVYWTIGEVAEELGEQTSVLRFWEVEFKKHLNFKRVNGIERKYDLMTRLKMAYIWKLMRVEKYTLDGARRQIELFGFEKEY